MNKHTPGPWTATADPYSDVVVDASGREIVVVMDPNGEANARLIAAAPDLLEALESVWLWMENQADGQSKGGHATFDLMMLREQRDIARAVIAKATGETT